MNSYWLLLIRIFHKCPILYLLSINHDSVIFYFKSWKKVYFLTCLVCIIFQWQRKKGYSLLKSLDQLSNLIIGFELLLLLLIDVLINLIVRFNPDFSCRSSFVLSYVDKVISGTESFVSVNANIIVSFPDLDEI